MNNICPIFLLLVQYHSTKLNNKKLNYFNYFTIEKQEEFLGICFVTFSINSLISFFLFFTEFNNSSLIPPSEVIRVNLNISLFN